MLNPKLHFIRGNANIQTLLANRLLLLSHSIFRNRFLPPRFESNFYPTIYLRKRILRLRGGHFRNCLEEAIFVSHRSKAWTFEIICQRHLRAGFFSPLQSEEETFDERVTNVQAMAIIGGGSRGTISWQWTRPALNVDGELIEILFRLDACNGCFVSNVCFLRLRERETEEERERSVRWFMPWLTRFREEEEKKKKNKRNESAELRSTLRNCWVTVMPVRWF